MYKIPSILTTDEVLDKAFKRASKVQVTVKDKFQRHNRIAIAKVRAASNTISSTLNKYIKSFPSFENIPLFYYELFDVSIGIDDLKKSLGALDWCKKKVMKIADEAVKNIIRSRNKTEIQKFRNAAYGRFSSILKQISSDLDLLSNARKILLSAPVIDAKKPTVVIAGAPNVGKSLLVARISSAKPKIASYPFTTKGISIGHFESNGRIYQVIDTPGLLDRKMNKRNEMELKAILALRHLANVIVFVIDPSEYCGYEMDMQLRILSDINSQFSGIPIIEVENKVDILRLESTRLKISAIEKKGIEDLKEAILANFHEKSI